MANFNSLHAYDADALYPSFAGLMQYGGGIGTDPRYALEAENMETPGGVLQPAAACQLMAPQLPHPIETLARLYRRWYTGSDEKELLVAACAGKLYAALPTATTWTELPMPPGVDAYACNVWSWVTYEINPPAEAYDSTATYRVGDYCKYNDDPYRCITAILEPEEWTPEHWEQTELASVDVLLLSNAEDGMIMVRGDNLTVDTVVTPKKFGIIERYAERIWGGAITDDPDMLVYSRPYIPTDWTPDTEIPEEGAGDIQQPSWDGDSFTSLKSFGSQLIAFKRTRVWRILGTDPGEYAFKEQYGGGAPYPATIAVDGERIFMLTSKGVSVYDGLSVNPFQQQAIEDVIRTINLAYLDQSTACIWRDKYYCAFPTGESQINNTVLIYDTQEGSWLLRSDVSVESFLPTETGLYFTSSTTPGRVWQWQEDSWQTGLATGAATRWVTPWNDFSAKKIVKGGFEVYLLMEVQNAPATISVSIQTEKKIKTKRYTLQPLTAEQRAAGRNYKQKRLHFGGSGRRFRLIIESEAGQPVWRLNSGISVVAEIDPD